VLADGWLYPVWVVGASGIRGVEGEWPSPGARIHHSVGFWPMTIDDTTEVIAAEPEMEITLQARAWPGGEASLKIRIEPEGAGSLVTLTEDASHGPARFVPAAIRIPLLGWRNKECLRRLASVVEGRAR
jgi:hypothetical protein